MADSSSYKHIIEAAIMASDCPLSIERLSKLFDEPDTPSISDLKQIIETIKSDYQGRGVELKEVASGYRFQVNPAFCPWVQKIWQERPQKYSRALLETLALIIYKQPITRSEVEEIRGVAVSSTLVKTLMEREWIKVVGYKEMPGKPALYGSTKQFLDDFNLKSLSDLPPLSDLKDLETLETEIEKQLQLPVPDSIAVAIEGSVQLDVETSATEYMYE